MKRNLGEWIVLGTTQIRVEWLQSVTEKEALEFLKGKSVHPDRIRNAWKQANRKK
jgi:hypothetical protein